MITFFNDNKLEDLSFRRHIYSRQVLNHDTRMFTQTKGNNFIKIAINEPF